MQNLDFVALDVETADSAYPESICQIGLAIVRNGEIVETACHLVHTPHKFAWWQRQNLKIEESAIAAAPSFFQIAQSISTHMRGPVFSHTSYDKLAVARASTLAGHSFGETEWLDSAQVVRRAWPDRYGQTGYGLKAVAADLGIEFAHHDAGEDARAVAAIIIRASVEHGLDLDGWRNRVRGPINKASETKPDLRRDGNVDGPLFGEVVVLTGGFDMPKAEQANLAAFAGCQVSEGVTKRTTLVVVGDDRFNRSERSGKWKRAEELAQLGHPIRVMSETDFLALIAD